MTDIADLASEREELIRAAALAERKPEGPKATGHCLECGHPFAVHKDGRRWCNAECRDDWERRNGRG